MARTGSCALLFGMVVLALAGSAHAATYYVRMGGDDSHAGTGNSDAEAWATIGHCASSVQAGDSCRAQEGSYDEIVTTQAGGTGDGSRLSFVADGAVVVQGFVIGNDYVTVQGFEVTACPSCGGQLDVSADHVQLLDNVVHDNPNGDGTEISVSGSYALVRGNHIYSSLARGGDYALIALGCNYCTIEGNELGPGVDVDDFRVWGHDTVISANYVHDSTLSDGSGAHMDGLQTFGDNGGEAYNIVFERNLLRMAPGNTAQMFTMSNDSLTTIHDFVYRNNVWIGFGLQANIGIPNTIVVNNTFIDIDVNNGFTFNLCYGGGFDDTGAVIKNNIIVQTWDDAPYGDDGRVDGDYNLVSKLSGGSYLPLPGWSEAHGVSGGDPKFVSYAGDDTSGANDFHLLADSAAVDQGTDLSALGFSTDYDGVTRPQGAGWDIGAYEYCSGDACAPADGGAPDGSAPDGSTADGGTTPDAGGGAANAESGGTDSGCGCRLAAAGTRGGIAGGLLVALMLGLLRRRRSRT